MAYLRMAAVALATLMIAGHASAQSMGGVRTLGSAAGIRTANSSSPIPGLALRGGIMLSPRGGAIAGADLAIPSLGLMDSGETRLDVDIIMKANFAGMNTVIPVTLSQIRYAPSVGGRATYFGGGVGGLLGGKMKFDAKLILGADLASKLGAELNVHFTEGKTLFCVVGRLIL